MNTLQLIKGLYGAWTFVSLAAAYLFTRPLTDKIRERKFQNSSFWLLLGIVTNLIGSSVMGAWVILGSNEIGNTWMFSNWIIAMGVVATYVGGALHVKTATFYKRGIGGFTTFLGGSILAFFAAAFFL